MNKRGILVIIIPYSPLHGLLQRSFFLRCEKQCGGAENTKLSDSVLLGFSWTCGEFSFAGVYTERESVPRVKSPFGP